MWLNKSNQDICIDVDDTDDIALQQNNKNPLSEEPTV